jgi:molybdenum cofactor cytidylyltransferase
MAGTVAAVVLAAGEGRRFGGDKLAAVWQGSPLLAHTLRAVASHPGVVVHRPGDSIVERAALASGMTPRENPHPEFGLSESLRVGVTALDPAATEWALIVLGDQPLLRSEVIAALIAATDPGHDLIRPIYAEEPGSPGHPVLVHRRLWPLAGSLRGDQGFGAVATPQRICLVPVSGSNPDVDTPADLDELPASLLTSHSSPVNARRPR